MTDLSKLGEELRRELGQPPPGWTERQRLRLRGVALEKRTPSRLPFLLAALGLFTLTAAGAAYFRKPAHEPLAGGSAPSSPRPERGAAGPEEEGGMRDAWLGGVGSQRSYPIPGGGSISLDEDARGRLDESRAEGTRFDLHEGRASFDVKLREKSPFSVVAGEYRIVVVGTKFSVAYQAPDVLDVIVTQGIVEVHLPSRVERLQVHAGESLAASSAGFSVRNDVGAKISPAVSPAPPPSPPATAPDWRKLYHEGMYEAACRAARPTDLRSKLDVTALIELAGALGLCGETDAALTTLQTVRKRFPAAPEANDALFLMGRIHARRGSQAEAISHFEGYLQRGSGGRFAAEALGRLIELHRAAGHHDEAKKFAARYLKMAPQGAYHRLAQSLLDAH